METDWGAVLTIGIYLLVELKKTQRLEDHPIIGKLILAWFHQPECTHTSNDFFGAAKYFHPAGTGNVLCRAPRPRQISRKISPLGDRVRAQLLAGGEVAENVDYRVVEFFQGRIADLQRADCLYGRDIICELRKLRTAGVLMPEGSQVPSVI